MTGFNFRSEFSGASSLEFTKDFLTANDLVATLDPINEIRGRKIISDMFAVMFDEEQQTVMALRGMTKFSLENACSEWVAGQMGVGYVALNRIRTKIHSVMYTNHLLGANTLRLAGTDAIDFFPPTNDIPVKIQNRIRVTWSFVDYPMLSDDTGDLIATQLEAVL